MYFRVVSPHPPHPPQLRALFGFDCVWLFAKLIYAAQAPSAGEEQKRFSLSGSGLQSFGSRRRRGPAAAVTAGASRQDRGAGRAEPGGPQGPWDAERRPGPGTCTACREPCGAPARPAGGVLAGPRRGAARCAPGEARACVSSPPRQELRPGGGGAGRFALCAARHWVSFPPHSSACEAAGQVLPPSSGQSACFPWFLDWAEVKTADVRPLMPRLAPSASRWVLNVDGAFTRISFQAD